MAWRYHVSKLSFRVFLYVPVVFLLELDPIEQNFLDNNHKIQSQIVSVVYNILPFCTISLMFVDCLRDDDYKPEDRTPHLLSQGELNDLIRDLNLSKRKAEIQGSRMQQWNLLRPNTRISKNVKMISLLFFKIQDGLVYCNDVEGLMCKLGIVY